MADGELTLRSYFESSPDLFCELNEKGAFLYVNQAWKALLGYEPNELLGRSFEDFLHPQDRQSSRDAFERSAATREPLFQNRYRHKDGRYLIFRWSGYVGLNGDLIIGHARDVTEQVQKAELLSHVTAIQDVYMHLGATHRGLFEELLVELLPALESTDGFITGTRPDELITKNTQDIYARTAGFSDDDITSRSSEVLSSGLPQFTGTAEADSFCAIPLHHRGELVGIIGLSHRHCGFNAEFLVRTKPVIEAISSIVGLYHASVRENTLRERFAVIVENLPIMLTEFGSSGHVTWANRHYREKVGLTEADIESSDKLRDVIRDDADRARAFMLSGRTDWEEFTLYNQAGESFQSLWTNVRLKNGRAIGIGQDITERRIAEAKMIQSSKMASLGEMSAGVSHEINNPLAIIQGSAFRAIQNLSESTTSNAALLRDEVESDLNRIIQNCDRIARIVRGLRAFSRSADHEPFTRATLTNIVDEVLNLANERFINHKVRINTDLGPMITIDCRPVQLGQVLMNLLNNAYDAVSESDESRRSVWIQARQKNEVVQISVEDNGHGVPDSVRDRILEPFFTTKDVGKGTGLGLSISKGIVESHNGRLWLDAESKRTRFVIELPIRQADQSP